MKEEEERGPIELVNLKHEDDADLDEEVTHHTFIYQNTRKVM